MCLSAGSLSELRAGEAAIAAIARGTERLFSTEVSAAQAWTASDGTTIQPNSVCTTQPAYPETLSDSLALTCNYKPRLWSMITHIAQSHYINSKLFFRGEKSRMERGL